MKVLIRKTLTGSEYWDTEDKCTLFVVAGKKPNFDVTANPKTMIGGVDLATGKDATVTTTHIPDNKHEMTMPDINLDDMNVEQLLSFAEQNDITVPGNMKKEDTIRKHIADSL